MSSSLKGRIDVSGLNNLDCKSKPAGFIFTTIGMAQADLDKKMTKKSKKFAVYLILNIILIIYGCKNKELYNSEKITNTIRLNTYITKYELGETTFSYYLEDLETNKSFFLFTVENKEKFYYKKIDNEIGFFVMSLRMSNYLKKVDSVYYDIKEHKKYQK